MRSLLLSAWLAVTDLFHERVLSICVSLGLVSALSPLLILYGMKSGVVQSARERLLLNPANLNIHPDLVPPGFPLNDAWFESMRKHPGTGFIIPQAAYSATASLQLRPADGQREGSVYADIWPTAAGDPILRTGGVSLRPPAGMECILSQKAAQDLNANPGQRVHVIAYRTTASGLQEVELSLSIAGVLPGGAMDSRVILTPLHLVEAVEDYKEGREVPRFGWGKADVSPRTDSGAQSWFTPLRAGLLEGAYTAGLLPRPQRKSYTRFRLYASSLEAVAPLTRMLNENGIQVRTAASRIEETFALDRQFTLIFRLIAAIAVAGGALSLLAGLVASVERKRHDLAVLKMIGFPGLSLAALPVFQALALTAVAVAISGGFFLLFQKLFSSSSMDQEGLCRLTPIEFQRAALAALGLSAAVALLAAIRVVRVQPAEALRRE